MRVDPKPSVTHHLTVHTPAGDSRHYQVESVHKLSDRIATVTIRAGDWLDLGTYAATHEAGEQRAASHCITVRLAAIP